MGHAIFEGRASRGRSRKESSLLQFAGINRTESAATAEAMPGVCASFNANSLTHYLSRRPESQSGAF
jgi:hypothetical protein